MKNCNISTKEVNAVKEILSTGEKFNAEGKYCQYFTAGKAMMRYDFITGKYKIYTDLNKFARAIVRFNKIGY